MLLKVFKYFVLSEPLFAAFAREEMHHAMAIQMFLLVRHLVEFHLASFHGTREWLLISMYSQVVEQIVPFPEKLPTVVVVAREGT